MKILVTGGAGFVGSHIVDVYLSAGYKVVVIDNLSTGQKSNLNPKAKFYKTDIRDAKAIKTIFETEKPDIVNHLAAQKSVRKSITDSLYDANVNILGLLPLLENSVRHSVKKFIFTSTGGAIYGNAKIVPTPETHSADIMSPYTLTKYMGEQYIQLFHRLYHLPYTILRPSNIYGPRQIPDGESGVVAIYFENIMKGKSSVLFNSPDMKNGATRDYIYVEDVARANILVLKQGDNTIFNIGTGKEICTKDIYTNISNIIGKKSFLQKKNMNKEEVTRSALDYKKAHALLGWRPLVSLQEGLKRTYQSYV